jgi:hypothetical protein
MKKLLYIFLVTGIVFLMSSVTSCTKDCKQCKIVTYNAAGDKESETTPEEYCDDDLDKVDGKVEEDPSGTKAVYECE